MNTAKNTTALITQFSVRSRIVLGALAAMTTFALVAGSIAATATLAGAVEAEGVSKSKGAASVSKVVSDSKYTPVVADRLGDNLPVTDKPADGTDGAAGEPGAPSDGTSGQPGVPSTNNGGTSNSGSGTGGSGSGSSGSNTGGTPSAPAPAPPAPAPAPPAPAPPAPAPAPPAPAPTGFESKSAAISAMLATSSGSVVWNGTGACAVYQSGELRGFSTVAYNGPGIGHLVVGDRRVEGNVYVYSFQWYKCR